jgi:hypothetical protein
MAPPTGATANEGSVILPAIKKMKGFMTSEHHLEQLSQNAYLMPVMYHPLQKKKGINHRRFPELTGSSDVFTRPLPSPDVVGKNMYWSDLVAYPSCPT